MFALAPAPLPRGQGSEGMCPWTSASLPHPARWKVRCHTTLDIQMQSSVPCWIRLPHGEAAVDAGLNVLDLQDPCQTTVMQGDLVVGTSKIPQMHCNPANRRILNELHTRNCVVHDVCGAMNCWHAPCMACSRTSMAQLDSGRSSSMQQASSPAMLLLHISATSSNTGRPARGIVDQVEEYVQPSRLVGAVCGCSI